MHGGFIIMHLISHCTMDQLNHDDYNHEISRSHEESRNWFIYVYNCPVLYPATYPSVLRAEIVLEMLQLSTRMSIWDWVCAIFMNTYFLNTRMGIDDGTYMAYYDQQVQQPLPKAAKPLTVAIATASFFLFVYYLASSKWTKWYRFSWSQSSWYGFFGIVWIFANMTSDTASSQLIYNGRLDWKF